MLPTAPDLLSSPESDPEDGEEIPPAIACAHCGRAGCDGCAPENTAHPSAEVALPWETPGGEKRLLRTAELASHDAETTFGTLTQGSLTRALSFAFWAELWAVGSFCVVWALGFYALFPFLARQMLHSWVALAIGHLIFVALVLGVVSIHALWGAALEWGIGRAGSPKKIHLGLRFGLYACGWDLLTSPASILLYGGRPRAILRAVRAGARAPRPAMNAYLRTCRGLDEAQARKALFLGSVLVILAFLGIVVVGLVAFVVVFFPELVL